MTSSLARENALSTDWNTGAAHGTYLHVLISGSIYLDWRRQGQRGSSEKCFNHVSKAECANKRISTGMDHLR